MPEAPLPHTPPWLTRVANVTQQAQGANELITELLHVLQELTGLDSTYLTRMHWNPGAPGNDGVQEILQSLNTGEIQVPAPHEIPWEQTLCRRAWAEPSNWVDDVQERWPDSATAATLGLQTYVSTPIQLPSATDDAPWGTLCGAAKASIQGNDAILTTMRLFAQLIGDAVQREETAKSQEARVAAAEQRLRQRTELTAVAEHAMKSPAATIRMWADTLAQRWENLPEHTRKDGLASIQRAADRLLAQITDLVREGRTEILAGDLNLERLDLLDVARDGRDLVHTDTHQVIAEGRPTRALADREALRLILEHLVDNARAHTPEGTNITIEATTHDDHPVLVVRDDGPGLPEGVDIFAPFVRGNHDHAMGTGLGLHIVRSMAEAMGGSVTARNDGGAVFTVHLVA